MLIYRKFKLPSSRFQFQFDSLRRFSTLTKLQTSQTIQEAINIGKDFLKGENQNSKNSVERLEAELLLSHVLNTNRLSLLTNNNKKLNLEEVNAFQKYFFFFI